MRVSPYWRYEQIASQGPHTDPPASCEGLSIRATARVSKNTVVKLLIDAGRAFAYQDDALRDLRRRIHEIWSFIYAKEKNVPRAKAARSRRCLDLDRDLRGHEGAWGSLGNDRDRFMDDLRPRLRIGCSSPATATAYLESAEGAFGGEDYAQ